MTKQEAVLECRRRSKDGEFNRKIIERVPEDVTYDTVHLSCGHSQLELPVVEDEEKEEISCLDCEKEWIRQNTD